MRGYVCFLTVPVEVLTPVLLHANKFFTINQYCEKLRRSRPVRGAISFGGQKIAALLRLKNYFIILNLKLL